METTFVFNRPEETENWCEICEEAPATTTARFIDAKVCASCAASEPAVCANCDEEEESISLLDDRAYCRACQKEDIVHGCADDHTEDAHCTVDTETNECRICHVFHGDPCQDCGGRGYHNQGCPIMLELEPGEETLGR